MQHTSVYHQTTPAISLQVACSLLAGFVDIPYKTCVSNKRKLADSRLYRQGRAETPLGPLLFLTHMLQHFFSILAVFWKDLAEILRLKLVLKIEKKWERTPKMKLKIKKY
jgi:hypothetical protein